MRFQNSTQAALMQMCCIAEIWHCVVPQCMRLVALTNSSVLVRHFQPARTMTWATEYSKRDIAFSTNRGLYFITVPGEGKVITVLCCGAMGWGRAGGALPTKIFPSKSPLPCAVCLGNFFPPPFFFH